MQRALVRLGFLSLLLAPPRAHASTQVVFNGGADTPATNSTEYATLMGLEESVWESTLSEHEGIVPTTGSLSRLHIRLTAAPGAGRSYTFALMKNGAATGLTCTVANVATACTDVINAVAIAAGD